MQEIVLLIWEQIPETTEMYLINADTALAQLAIASAGDYIGSINTPDDSPVHQLNELLMYCAEDLQVFKSLGNNVADFQLGEEQRIVRIVRAGFLM